MVALFALLGIASTYSMLTFTSPISIAALHAVFKVDGETRGCIFIAGIFDRRGNPVEGTLTLISNNTEVYTFEKVSKVLSRDLSICRSRIDRIEMLVQSMGFSLRTKYSVHRSRGWSTVDLSGPRPISFSVDMYEYGRIIGPFVIDTHIHVFFSLFINDLRLLNAKLYVLTINTTAPTFELSKPITLYYTFVNMTDSIPKRLGGDTYYYTITIKDNVEVFDLLLDINKSSIVLYTTPIESLNKQQLTYAIIPYTNIILEERTYLELIMGSVGLGLYHMFFPIAVLYIAYTFISKPKSTGALEFVLARPITRSNLYFSRYIAGAIAIAIATAAFLAIIAVAYPLVLKVGLEPWCYIVLYLGISASLITFYTIYHAIAFSVRSGLYLGIAIVIYLLLSILWNIILFFMAISMNISIMSREFVELGYTLSYLNPLNFVNLARYHIYVYYGVEQEIPIVNPSLCILTPIAWNIVFYLLGLWRFKKISLMG